jgi:Holliday junction resolvase RusA-like endonuclease
MRSVTFTVIGIAQPKGSTRAFLPRGARFPVVTSDNPRAKDWEHCVASQAQTVAADGPFLGPVALRVSFALPRPASLPRRILAHVRRPDVDKLLRCAADALTGVLYRDDAQIVELHARKVYAAIGEAPSAEITVRDAAPFAAMPTTEGWLFEEA